MTLPDRTLRWLEIAPDYRCNNRCVGCFSVAEGSGMSTGQVLAALRDGRARGATRLWLGGGEPTLRRDLFAVVERARSLGYEEVRLQTNGMLLSYGSFASRAADAGVTEVSFSIKGATAETHDRLTQTPGCHELMLAGMAEVRRLGLRMEGDVLVYRSNVGELVEVVRGYAALGIERFYFWLLSAADAPTKAVADEVPRIADVVPQITAAMDLQLADDPQFIVSLHTPACTVPPSHHRCLFHAADLDLWVHDAGGHGFFLETSPIEGGVFPEACGGCAVRARCGGARADYLAIHGEAEFVGT